MRTRELRGARFEMAAQYNDGATDRAAGEAAMILVSRELLQGALEALNDVRNTPLRDGRRVSTYHLAAEIARVLKSSRNTDKSAT